mmetsp:Transcript_18606/g.40287  ORF Transcript_18606/g.40287 Transcript_18606/m.40287 type:complete len:205 (+) Transcript_18606:3422-4036(+)
MLRTTMLPKRMLKTMIQPLVHPNELANLLQPPKMTTMRAKTRSKQLHRKNEVEERKKTMRKNQLMRFRRLLLYHRPNERVGVKQRKLKEMIHQWPRMMKCRRLLQRMTMLRNVLPRRHPRKAGGEPKRRTMIRFPPLRLHVPLAVHELPKRKHRWKKMSRLQHRRLSLAVLRVHELRRSRNRRFQLLVGLVAVPGERRKSGESS